MKSHAAKAVLRRNFTLIKKSTLKNEDKKKEPTLHPMELGMAK